MTPLQLDLVRRLGSLPLEEFEQLIRRLED
jgi:hypothetical protein